MKVKEIIATNEAPKAIGPYSQAVKAGGFIFVSGQIPLVPSTGEIVAGGIEEQTEQVMQNLQAILSSQGLTFTAVVKTSVFLKDMNDFAAMNGIYGKYFSQEPPARACVQVGKLPKDVLVEVELIAAAK